MRGWSYKKGWSYIPVYAVDQLQKNQTWNTVFHLLATVLAATIECFGVVFIPSLITAAGYLWS
jgi:hypothetical protein